MNTRPEVHHIDAEGAAERLDSIAQPVETFIHEVSGDHDLEGQGTIPCLGACRVGGQRRPAFGWSLLLSGCIVAAVLGIINTMSAIAEGPEVVGEKVAAALTLSAVLAQNSPGNCPTGAGPNAHPPGPPMPAPRT